MNDCAGDSLQPDTPVCGRRVCPFTDEKSIEQIAERAAAKAVQKITDSFYRDIGRGVVNKVLTILGLLAVVAYFWLSGKGVKP